MTKPLEVHPLNAGFRNMHDDELAALAADIKAHGQREPIVMYEGKVLDGMQRLRACELAGIKPRTRDYDLKKEGNPVAYVLSANLHRRHLKGVQKALAVALSVPRGTEPPTRHETCIRYGLSATDVSLARAVLALPEEKPQRAELIARICAGGVTRAALARELGVGLGVSADDPDNPEGTIDDSDPADEDDVAEALGAGTAPSRPPTAPAAAPRAAPRATLGAGKGLGASKAAQHQPSRGAIANLNTVLAFIAQSDAAQVAAMEKALADRKKAIAKKGKRT